MGNWSHRPDSNRLLPSYQEGLHQSKFLWHWWDYTRSGYFFASFFNIFFSISCCSCWRCLSRSKFSLTQSCVTSLTVEGFFILLSLMDWSPGPDSNRLPSPYEGELHQSKFPGQYWSSRPDSNRLPSPYKGELHRQSFWSKCS